MSRAAIVIGVNKTGGLPVLRDAAAGAMRVAAWLESERYQTLKLVDEETAGVFRRILVSDVREAVLHVLAPGTCEQLVIYFAGHGTLNDGSELWLLSEAPENANEAIIVEENVLIARDCGVPNVIFVSDACRSTPLSIRANRVRGMLIFPNSGVNPVHRADVDRFFACLPGDPAYEVTVDKSSGAYSALFTACLQAAYVETPKSLTCKIDDVEVLPNRNLRRLLPILVEVRARDGSTTVFQKPDAIVESDPEIYIGAVHRAAVAANRTPETPPDGPNLIPKSLGGDILGRIRGEEIDRIIHGATGTESQAITKGPGPPTLRSYGENLMAQALGVGKESGPPSLPHSDRLQSAINVAAQLTEVDHFETGLGVRGADTVEVLGIGCEAQIVNVGARGEDRLVRVVGRSQGQPIPFAGTVLLRFDGGDGAAIPAIEGYICTVVVDRHDGDVPTAGIAQVAYTPTNDPGFQPQRTQVESLRALVAGLTRNGVFHLDKEIAKVFGERIVQGKKSDPTLGIYAAYAFSEAGLTDRILFVKQCMEAGIYDVALLLREAKADNYTRLLPFCPMLSQGWALLRALGGELPPAVRDASAHRRASLWTTFRPEGTNLLFEAARNGGLK